MTEEGMEEIAAESQGLMDFSSFLIGVVDAAVGIRNHAIEGGFCQEAADEIGVAAFCQITERMT